MKTSVSKAEKIGIFPNWLLLGFGEKFEILSTFRWKWEARNLQQDISKLKQKVKKKKENKSISAGARGAKGYVKLLDCTWQWLNLFFKMSEAGIPTLLA